MKITISRWPTDEDWLEVKRRALVTAGLSHLNNPSQEWKEDILRERQNAIVARRADNESN